MFLFLFFFFENTSGSFNPMYYCYLLTFLFLRNGLYLIPICMHEYKHIYKSLCIFLEGIFKKWKIRTNIWKPYQFILTFGFVDSQLQIQSRSMQLFWLEERCIAWMLLGCWNVHGSEKSPQFFSKAFFSDLLILSWSFSLLLKPRKCSI